VTDGGGVAAREQWSLVAERVGIAALVIEQALLWRCRRTWVGW
jgi:hypothetical protein